MRKSWSQSLYRAGVAFSGAYDPHSLALGLSLGLFVGLLPIMGVQTALVIPLAYALRANRAIAVAAVWITNPVTAVPIYVAEHALGAALLGWNRVGFTELLHALQGFTVAAHGELARSILVPLAVGSLVTSTSAALVGYVAVRALRPRCVHHARS